MAIRLYKSYTAGTRNRSVADFRNLTVTKSSVKQLKVSKRKTGGRNNQGLITVRHRGGGHKPLRLSCSCCLKTGDKDPRSTQPKHNVPSHGIQID